MSITHGYMMKDGDKHFITRLVSMQNLLDRSHGLNRELDAFSLQFNMLLASIIGRKNGKEIQMP